VFTTAVAVAIVRHHLYDIDPLINRTLVYGLLTALVVGLYVATVSLLGVAFRQRAGLLASLVATGVVAVVFQPLRERLQRWVNRLLYGERQDPYRVLAGLGQRLEATVAPQAVLPGVVEAIAQALRLPYVAIELGRGNELEPVAVWGPAVGEPFVVPLVYQAEPIGRLLLGPRARGEPFSPADRRLLADLAGPVAMAASAVRLTGDLQRSRQRLVTALEEERRRLRRDLHDGLGPALAGVTLEIGAARNLLGRDPAAADALLARLQAETKAATAEIRRVAYGLRPPALDELGLVGAQSGNQIFTVTDTPQDVVLVDEQGATCTLRGATWFGGATNDSTGAEVITATHNLLIIAQGGGVADSVHLMERFRSGELITHEFGTCQLP